MTSSAIKPTTAELEEIEAMPMSTTTSMGTSQAPSTRIMDDDEGIVVVHATQETINSLDLSSTHGSSPSESVVDVEAQPTKALEDERLPDDDDVDVDDVDVTGNQSHTGSDSQSHRRHSRQKDKLDDGEFDSMPQAAAAAHDSTIVPFYILPSIVICQFAGTSLWFAGNAVMDDLMDEYGLDATTSLGYLTSAVQLGFIMGTMALALTNLADRYSPTRLFGIMSFIGATMNGILPVFADLIYGDDNNSDGVLGIVITLRLFTGFALAGIYPVGMKVASDWYASTGLGWALGLLVGALAFGSAFPFLLNQIQQDWTFLLWETSALAALGGLWMAFVVPNGPHRKAASKADFRVVYTLFEGRLFRSAAFGYFGHMWELYAFWTWSPLVIRKYLEKIEHEDPGNPSADWSPSLIAFLVLAIGSVGCVLGGLLAERLRPATVAVGSLIISGTACLLSPLVYMYCPPGIFLAFYLIWGMAVVSDSPQFSCLVALTAPAENKGTALTIVNCLGFAITIGSIQLLGGVPFGEQYLFLLLFPGPLFGLWSMRWHFSAE